MQKTFKITITGQVQGVGFRPYVYNLATKFNITGTVSNNEKGVIIFATGNQLNVETFYQTLINQPPPISIIQKSYIEEISFQLYNEFNIIPTQTKGQLNLPLTPDFAICDDCKNEIENPKNRRYNYPFTTCVNCGPRWAITNTFPFERANTSINDFPMCEVCLDEYTTPADRRFHSQTNTCKTCGISLELLNNRNKVLPTTKEALFENVAKLIAAGNIIALKNTSGYLLCCNAEDEKVVQKLRILKKRPNKPFAVMYPSLLKLKKELDLTKKQEATLTSSERPITIIPLNNYKGKIGLEQVAPRLNQLGVMLPYTGILQLLANKLNFPIVATSGNIHGSPIISTSKEALHKLNNIADYFVNHNLKIQHPQDDSVVKFSEKYQQQVIFRRSRGYAPNYLETHYKSSEKIMAFGAHLKSSIAFYPNKNFYVSQYLGNLDNFDVYNRFTKTITNFTEIFRQQPETVLVDKHPLYQSTQYGKEFAKKTATKLYEIQHHKAHFTAILGEHHLFNKRVLGVVFDGTGYGDDANIWGGEFFNYENNKVERIGHLEYFDWLLGDKMANEPRLSLFALTNNNSQSSIKNKFTEQEFNSYTYIKQHNKLKASSVGRLFDAVASLLNITDYNTYEGEAAILLENQLTNYNLAKCKVYTKATVNGFSGVEIIQNISKDIAKGEQLSVIISNFLYTLANVILEFAKLKNYNTIAVSGGVFQNTTLVDMLFELKPKNVTLYVHHKLAPNDENISFGQLMYYMHIK
ncbi:MAG TPA: carbamoyltransferase HypF [Flavobacteriaceae bacterium]|nr:carbamoyltransferase HypF [Flavobacteriaceae bacterium]